MTSLAVVIVSRNSGPELAGCLRSLQEGPPAFPWEVVVVDNGSTDGSVAAVRSRFPWVRLVAGPANAGFAKGCNAGAACSLSKYLLFLNPDTEVPPRTLAGAVEIMERRPSVGVLGPRTLGRDGRVQPTAFGFPSPLRVFGTVAGLNRWLKVSRLRSAAWTADPVYVQGSFLLVRRSLFEALGGFDEDFFVYSEDVDLCLRVRGRGWDVRFEPGLSITHAGGASSGDPVRALDPFVRSLFTLYRKHRAADLGRLRLAIRAGLALRRAAGAAGRLVRAGTGAGAAESDRLLRGLARFARAWRPGPQAAVRRP